MLNRLEFSEPNTPVIDDQSNFNVFIFHFQASDDDLIFVDPQDVTTDFEQESQETQNTRPEVNVTTDNTAPEEN